MWTDDEVDLVLSVILDYKVARTTGNVDWETCQSKYSDILNLFTASTASQYPSPENATQLGKEFPYKYVVYFRVVGYQISSIYVIVFKTFRLMCVHTYPDSLRFQRFPLWRVFSKVCGYSVRFSRIRVDGRRICNKMFANSNESEYMWTGPEFN